MLSIIFQITFTLSRCAYCPSVDRVWLHYVLPMHIDWKCKRRSYVFFFVCNSCNTFSFGSYYIAAEFSKDSHIAHCVCVTLYRPTDDSHLINVTKDYDVNDVYGASGGNIGNQLKNTNKSCKNKNSWTREHNMCVHCEGEVRSHQTWRCESSANSADTQSLVYFRKYFQQR